MEDLDELHERLARTGQGTSELLNASAAVVVASITGGIENTKITYDDLSSRKE